MSDTTSPTNKPGEVSGWPKLQMVYRSDPDRIADLLPPGITPGKSANVYVNIYCVPVLGEPEYGVSTKVEAVYDGIPGLYCLGMGIDQEAAVFISQELNGQPKFPCAIKFFRLGDQVEAVCTHQGYTFLEFRGQSRPVDVTPPSTRSTTGGSSRRAPSGASRRATTSRRTSCACTRAIRCNTPKVSTASSPCATARGIPTPTSCRCASRSRPAS